MLVLCSKLFQLFFEARNAGRWADFVGLYEGGRTKKGSRFKEVLHRKHEQVLGVGLGRRSGIVCFHFVNFWPPELGIDLLLPRFPRMCYSLRYDANDVARARECAPDVYRALALLL